MVKGFDLGPRRLAPSIVVVVLIVLGTLLPYVSIEYLNQTIEETRFRGTLFPGAQFMRGIQPEYLPPFYLGFTDLTPGLNVFNLGSSMQQIGAVIAVGLSWSVLAEEVNKFFWWPFHLSSYLLLLGPIPLFIGLRMLREQQVSVDVGPGWVPIAVAGAVILVISLRAHRRLDTYGSI